MKVIILAAGSRDTDLSQDAYPVWLAEFAGQPLLERLIGRLRALPKTEIHVALRVNELEKFHLDSVVGLIDATAQIVRVERETAGATCTALLAIEVIDSEEELVIVNGDELVDADVIPILEKFRSEGYGAGVLTFQSVHPRYSYVRLNESGDVVEAAEKRPISRHATAGFYWFKHGSDFVRAAQSQIKNRDDVDGKYYICPCLNSLILSGLPVAAFEIHSDEYHPLKTERQIDEYSHLIERAAGK